MSRSAGRCSGPDVPASVTTAELRQFVEGIRFIERMRAGAIDKNVLAAERPPCATYSLRAWWPGHDLPAGTVRREEHLTVKKTGTGIPTARLPEPIGARLMRDIRADELLRENDLEVRN